MSDSQLPTGTVTFLFTDIEGSTRLVQALGSDWPAVLEEHNRLLRTAIDDNGGVVVKTEGDAFFAAFVSAIDAVRAAAQGQRGLQAADWPGDARIRVRMGVHTGEGTLGGDDYVGLDVHRAARIAGAGHGDQIVISEPTAVLVERDIPDDLRLLDLGKHRLKDLAHPETLFQVDVAGLADSFPPLRTLDAVPNNLPLQATSFVGRRREIDEIVHFLERPGVLTLTGPGGTGKTRLALQAGAEIGGRFGDGVFFVDLAPVTEVEVVPSQVLSSLGIQGTKADDTPAENLLRQIAGKELLLILDNFEQIVGAASLVAEMHRAAPRSRFLVTSRSPLRISGEQELPVPPLSLPEEVGGDSDAIRLFAERAMAVRPDFRLTVANTDAVAELVRRLDGLPLAIELVASRVRLLSVRAILDRFDPSMLGGGAVDLPERQRTLDGAIGWSYQLLDSAEQQLFSRMSVFGGPARLTEIERVCGPDAGIDVLTGLEGLVDQSLVRSIQSDAEPQFRMLQVIREYAARLLQDGEEESEIRHRHLVTYTEVAEEAAPLLQGAERRQWLDRLAESHDNLRAALEWAAEAEEIDLARRLTSAVWRFWQARGHLHEARRRLEQVVDAPGGDPRWLARAMEALGGVLWWQGQTEQCRVVYGRAVELERLIGDPARLANALYNYALAVGFAIEGGRDEERLNEAMTVLDEAEAIYRELGDENGLGNIAWGRGNFVGLIGGDEASGLAHWEESLEHYRAAGNEFGMGWALFELALAAVRHGQPLAAWPRLHAGLELFARHHDVSAAVLFVATAAGLARDLGDDARSARLGGAFHALRLTSGTDLVTHHYASVEGLEFETLEALTGDLREAYLEGRAMDFDAAVAYALAGPVDERSEEA